MSEGLTVAQEAFRLGMIGACEGPFTLGCGQAAQDNTAAAYLAGLFVRWLAGFDVRPVDEDGEPFTDDEMVEWDLFDDDFSAAEWP